MASHDLFLEKKIIGVLMLSPGLLPKVCHITTDVFIDEQHAKAWTLVTDSILNYSNATVSGLWSKNRNAVVAAGGIDALEEYKTLGEEILTDPAPHIEKLYELYQWRKISNIANRLSIASKTKEKAPEDILSGMSTLIHNLLSNGKDSTLDKKDVIKKAIQRVSEKKPVTTTGLTPLDFLMQGGLLTKRMYGIGGLYGRGKTILLGSISDNLNSQKIPHLFISLETDPEDIELRNCAKHFNTNAALLSDSNSEDHEDLINGVDGYLDQVDNHTWYEFSPGATMNEIHRMILRAKSRHNIQGFIIDYWQLIEGRERGQSEEAHHRSNANRLAAICRQENLWCLITAQIDMNGKLKYSDSLLQAAALYVRMLREEDDEEVHFEIQKSNYTRYGSTYGASTPSVLFDMSSGPHFRNTSPIDAGITNNEDELDGDIEL